MATFGTEAQKARFLRPLRRAELLACQLFSEPGAGSDLAGLSCRAERDGDEWVVNGQKVWTSGAPHAAYGELIARTDPGAPKHKGLTAFLVPLDAPGVEIRPIRQMTGGASFSEVFFTDVRLGDDLRLGAAGDGWRVALTTLGFERSHSGAARRRPGGSFEQLAAAARHERLARSLPAAGSLNSWQASSSARRNGARNRAFCPAVPYVATVGAISRTVTLDSSVPAGVTKRASSSAQARAYSAGSPAPPHSSGPPGAA